MAGENFPDRFPLNSFPNRILLSKSGLEYLKGAQLGDGSVPIFG